MAMAATGDKGGCLPPLAMAGSASLRCSDDGQTKSKVIVRPSPRTFLGRQPHSSSLPAENSMTKKILPLPLLSRRKACTDSLVGGLTQPKVQKRALTLDALLLRHAEGAREFRQLLADPPQISSRFRHTARAIFFPKKSKLKVS